MLMNRDLQDRVATAPGSVTRTVSVRLGLGAEPQQAKNLPLSPKGSERFFVFVYTKASLASNMASYDLWEQRHCLQVT